MRLLPAVLLFLFLVPLPAGADNPEVIDVFVPRADGFAQIRIPSVVVTRHGTVFAFAEGRAAKTDQARNKILLKRSGDGGKTWGKLGIIADDGDNSLNNPCALVERETGTVWLMYQRYPAGIAERNPKLETGYEGDKVVRNLLIHSEDDGVTWSRSADVTRQTKRRGGVTTVASGPGIGIQLRHGKHAGRMLFPCNEGPWEQWNIYCVYSDDRGKTWRMGDLAPRNLIDSPDRGKHSTVNEAQIVELKDGSVRFNARRWAGPHLRKTCVSADGGTIWSRVKDAPELRDPSCMASVLRFSDPADGARSRILFSGPQSEKRENGTVFLSYDEGATWPVRRVLCLGSFGYSCLTKFKDGTIGCLYEADGATRIVFARLTLDWLSNGEDRLEKQ
jgi:sialidase-1